MVLLKLQRFETQDFTLLRGWAKIPECKLMLLNHAFEKLQCIAVTITANEFNIRSRKAIERLGAKLDGVLRNYKRQNGIVCDYYQYSIIDSEWPRIKTNLNYKLNDNNQ